MSRRPPLQAVFAPLALVAMVLMVCAPLVSRCLQAPGQAYAELCTPEGLKRVALGAAFMESMGGQSVHAASPPALPSRAVGHAGHGDQAGAISAQHIGHAGAAATLAGHASHDDAPGPSPAGHAGHGEAACDYCVLAVRLLPALLWLLALLFVAAPSSPVRGRAPWPLSVAAWPAHPARGPPLYA